MIAAPREYDAIVIGGGFYGAVIATYLATRRGFRNTLLVEQEAGLLQRASYHNQARVHNGYHYPRSFTTAFRSRVNLPQFVRDWPQAVSRDFAKLYGIARWNSKVTARQFVRFCQEIGARIEPAPPRYRALFDKRLIEEVFLVEEYAFDSSQLAAWAKQALAASHVQIRTHTRATSIDRDSERLRVTLRTGDGETEMPLCRRVFNCTYSGLNQLQGPFPETRTPLKQEIAELTLLDVPPELKGLGITVMDGPFFSLMPFPARGLHTLSHVRYTPHCHWVDEAGRNPYEELARYDRQTRIDRMLRDTTRYLPAIQGARYIESLYEIKTVLVRNEGDDGRPILFEPHAELPGCYSILGGKIDNIYDVLEKLDHEAIESDIRT